MDIFILSHLVSRRKGVILDFKFGPQIHVITKDNKKSLSFEITNSEGFSSNISGMLGQSIRPKEYRRGIIYLK